MERVAQIYELIGKAMADIGAIGKDSYNSQQKYKFRGIDAVYNALNPVLTKYGLFICPEILDQQREERTTQSGGLLKYTILTMRYRVFAPDGSSIEMTVVGEGMDAGDKSANKAMSVAMKYAMFQLFCIPTEELVDPDGESYQDVLPKGSAAPQKPAQSAPNTQKAQTPAPAQKAPQSGQKPPKSAQNVEMSMSEKAPPLESVETAESYRKQAWKKFGADFNDPTGEKLMAFRTALISGGLIEDIPLKQMTLPQIKDFFKKIYENYGEMAEAV